MAEAEKKSFFGGSGLNPDIKFENSIKKTSLIYPLDLNHKDIPMTQTEDPLN